MKTRTIIVVVVFLALCAVKLLLPQKVTEIRDSIIPSFSSEQNLRGDIIALGRVLSGAGNSLYAWEHGKNADIESSAKNSSTETPRPSFDAASAEDFVLSDMVKQNLSQFKTPVESPNEQSAASASPNDQNGGSASTQAVQTTAPATTAPVTASPEIASAVFIAPETAPVETSSPESVQGAKVAAFLNEQAAFSDHAVPANVSYDDPVLPFTYAPPAKSAVSSEFGYRVHPIYNDVRFHYGTDFAVLDGDAILAFADGKVISVQEIKGYGMTVMLDHGNGYTTLYAHCGRVSVKYGDKVKCGDTIALAGHSGLVTGPNLHFELMHNGKYLNPEFYL